MLGAGASRGRPRPGLSRELPREVASSPFSSPRLCCPTLARGAGAPGGPELGAEETPRDGALQGHTA